MHAATQAGAVNNRVNLGLLHQVTSSLTNSRALFVMLCDRRAVLGRGGTCCQRCHCRRCFETCLFSGHVTAQQAAHVRGKHKGEHGDSHERPGVHHGGG